MASPPTSTKATIHWNKVICKEPGIYLGWPTIAQLPSDELIVVFSGGREEHVCPYGKTELVRSTDSGRPGRHLKRSTTPSSTTVTPASWRLGREPS